MNPTYRQIVQYLYGLLPMYQRVGKSAFKKNLDNIISFCEHLDNPQNKFKSIHVAGTNGKGSSAHMLASVMQAAGYHTGLYTSPHYKDFSERIRIDGATISQEFVIDFVETHKSFIEKLSPSFFELTVAMAFDYFARNDVDIAIIEVGLGGRLDSTNVIKPLVSLITNISLEHTDMLGNSIEQIAFEKGGIIKPGVPVVISEMDDKSMPVFQELANKRSVDLFVAEEEFNCKNLRAEPGKMIFDFYRHNQLLWQDIATDLCGNYQAKNISGVIKVLDLLPEHTFPLSENDFRKGLSQVKWNTGFKGRWQLLQQNPLVYCDAAHNENGVTELMENVTAINYNQLFIIWGMVKGKDTKSILSQLPKSAKYYFCSANIPRMLNTKELSENALKFGLTGKKMSNVNVALDDALGKASENDLILIAGSNFIVAEINNL